MALELPLIFKFNVKTLIKVFLFVCLLNISYQARPIKYLYLVYFEFVFLKHKSGFNLNRKSIKRTLRDQKQNYSKLKLFKTETQQQLIVYFSIISSVAIIL